MDIQAHPLSSCVTLAASTSLYLFPHLENGGNRKVTLKIKCADIREVLRTGPARGKDFILAANTFMMIPCQHGTHLLLRVTSRACSPLGVLSGLMCLLLCSQAPRGQTEAEIDLQGGQCVTWLLLL